MPGDDDNNTNELKTKDTNNNINSDLTEQPPEFNYARIGGALSVSDPASILATDTCSCFTASSRLMIIGTHWGRVYTLDWMGNIICALPMRTFNAAVSCVSVDVREEWVIACADDGRLCVWDVSEQKIVQVWQHTRALKALALDPQVSRVDFSNRSSSQFRLAVGGMAGELIIYSRGMPDIGVNATPVQQSSSWFGSSSHRSSNSITSTILHQGQGPIYLIKWRASYIAWCNDNGVKVYDTSSNARVSHIDRPSPEWRSDLYPCHLHWQSDHMLLVGWADSVIIVRVSPDAVTGRLVNVLKIIKMDTAVVGIAPYLNDQVIVLAYDDKPPTEQQDSVALDAVRSSPLPDIKIIDSAGVEVVCDALAVHAYEMCQPNDYELISMAEEQMFFIVSPKDIVKVTVREPDDRIAWFIGHDRLEEAYVYMKTLNGRNTTYLLEGVGELYLQQMLETGGEWEHAALLTKEVSGNDKNAWEKWVYAFAELSKLEFIVELIPVRNPVLSSTIYELVLAHYLWKDTAKLLSTLLKWPDSMYRAANIVAAVEDALTAHPSDTNLLESLVLLFTRLQNYTKVLDCYLRLGRDDVFDFIDTHNLHNDLLGRILPLMDYEETQSVTARTSVLQMLVSQSGRVPISKVVDTLKPNRKHLFRYLVAMNSSQPHSTIPYHQDMVKLYVDFGKADLLDFLRSSTDYSLETALSVCQKNGLVREQVYILGRMGQSKKALSMISEQLEDVNMAIEFAKEQDDFELWEDLIKYSLKKPMFIRALLEDASAFVDPVTLIQRIPANTRITGLRDAIVKIVHDFQLQVSLLGGCQNIFSGDSSLLLRTLVLEQKKSVVVGDKTVCPICNGSLFMGAVSRIATGDEVLGIQIFFCHHAFHDDCLQRSAQKNGLVDDVVSPSRKSSPVKEAVKTIGGSLPMASDKLRCPLCSD